MIDEQDPELWVREYGKLAGEMAQRAEATQMKLANLQGEASNEYCTITINAGGALEDIRFTSRARSLGPEELANEVKDAYAVAFTTMNGRTQQLLADIGPGNDEMLAFVADAVTPEMRERSQRVTDQQER